MPTTMRRLGTALAVALLSLFITTSVAVAPAYAATKISHADATNRLRNAGITWSSSGGCSNRNNPTCTSFEQVNLMSIQGIVTLKGASGCGINVTGGTETGHARANEYEAGHIAGAISVPIDALQKRLRTLPRDREYVAYCRGPYCVYADRAVELLVRSRRRARRLVEGFPEWRAAGLPTARGREPGVLTRRRTGAARRATRHAAGRPS